MHFFFTMNMYYLEGFLPWPLGISFLYIIYMPAIVLDIFPLWGSKHGFNLGLSGGGSSCLFLARSGAVHGDQTQTPQRPT